MQVTESTTRAHGCEGINNTDAWFGGAFGVVQRVYSKQMPLEACFFSPMEIFFEFSASRLTVLVFRRVVAFNDNVAAVDGNDRAVRRGVLLECRTDQKRWSPMDRGENEPEDQRAHTAGKHLSNRYEYDTTRREDGAFTYVSLHAFPEYYSIRSIASIAFNPFIAASTFLDKNTLGIIVGSSIIVEKV